MSQGYFSLYKKLLSFPAFFVILLPKILRLFN